jgi:RNA polymerase sigma factor (sigma-70 family)
MQPGQAFDTIPENELVKRIRDGEKTLFEIIIRRSNPYLYKIGRSYGFNHQDVEDLMQDSLIAAFVNLHQFEERSSFKTWISRIMLNQCNRKLQKHAFKNEKPNDISDHEKTIPMYQTQASTDMHSRLVNKELGRVIGQALVEIPMDYRMVFSLRELNGMSTAETAEALDISEGNVKLRLNRAKKMLRERIEKLYSTEDIFEFNLVYCDKIVDNVMQAINNPLCNRIIL